MGIGMGTAAAEEAFSLDALTEQVSSRVWGPVLIGLIFTVGIYLTVRTRFVQVRCLGRALKYTVQKEENGKGEVSAFGALCTSLSATIGTGNIVGVAAAIVLGGPGALLWMLTAAFFGMATKYAEGLLAVKYRLETRPGHFLGGPFYYIQRGPGARRRWLAKLFALFGTLAGLLGIGTMTQVNGILTAAQQLFDPDRSGLVFILGDSEKPFISATWTTVVVSAVVTLGAGLVILGGVRRIAGVSQVVVPFMAGAYVLFSLMILIGHARAIPDAVRLIVKSAFDPAAAGGAVSGLLLKNVIRVGVERGIFSNEAGLGSAPIAAASAKTNDPVRQGLVTMTGTFIDTFVICTMTGLSIVVTGAWNPQVTGEVLKGSEITAYAWRHGLPFPGEVSSCILTVCLSFFAFTTILGWSCYSERCLEYLTGSRRAIAVFRRLYIGAVFIGSYLTLDTVWNIADICNGLMAFPNLIALCLLAGVVARETRKAKS